jgi:S1-C subfamily serine protease
VAGSVAVFLGVLLYRTIYPAPIPPTPTEIDEIVQQVLASATPPAAYSARVYQAIYPSLVLIQTQSEDPDDEDGRGLGSGVVINDAGDILTALHVVTDAVEIELVFADGTHALAEIVTTDPEIDIAVLHPNRPPEVIVPAILGNLNSVRVGDEVFAVGNPLGLAGSLSAGVISGFDRSLALNESDQRLEGLIQFDAAVNPGNSGGPLLNRYGQVIGIVTGLINPSEQNFFIGIGFAVPINAAGGSAGAPPY